MYYDDIWIAGIKPGVTRNIVQALDQYQEYHSHPRPYYVTPYYDDAYDVLIPFRSNPKHKYVFHLDEKAESAKEGSGLDLTKIILLPKQETLRSAFPVSLPSDQYQALKKYSLAVNSSLARTINKYAELRAKDMMSMQLTSSEYGLLKCATYQNYEDKLKINNQILLVTDMLERISGNAVRDVAVESTDDYEEKGFQRQPGRFLQDGSVYYPPSFRLVEVRNNAIVPINDMVFKTRNEAINYGRNNDLNIVTYSSLISKLQPPETVKTSPKLQIFKF